MHSLFYPVLQTTRKLFKISLWTRQSFNTQHRRYRTIHVQTILIVQQQREHQSQIVKAMMGMQHITLSHTHTSIDCSAHFIVNYFIQQGMSFTYLYAPSTWHVIHILVCTPGCASACLGIREPGTQVLPSDTREHSHGYNQQRKEREAI